MQKIIELNQLKRNTGCYTILIFCNYGSDRASLNNCTIIGSCTYFKILIIFEIRDAKVNKYYLFLLISIKI